MAIDSAKTLTSQSTITSAIKNKYYDKLFLRIAETKFVHKQLGQIDRKIGQGEGGYGTGVVQWTKWVNLPTVTAGQGEGVPTTAVAMSASNVTGSTAQYDAAVSISDLLAYTAFGDVMKAAMERLAYNAGLSIDTIVRNVISTGGTIQNATSLAAANWTAIPATAVLSVGELRKARRTLQRNDTPTLGDGNYVGVLHPDASYDLMGDTTTGAWIDANKYNNPQANKLLEGEIGKLYGIRFLETSNGYVRGTGVATSGSVYVTSIFGKDAFGVTELQNLKTYVKGFGSGGIADPTEKVATAGWKTTFGAAVLNSNFFVNIHHAVSSTA
jgi:N4-gp56 family major capsid protein